MQHQFNKWTYIIILFSIIVGGLRSVTRALTVMIYTPWLGIVGLILALIGVISLSYILKAKKWALFLWIVYALTTAIINDVIIKGKDYVYLMFAFVQIILMFFVLQLKKNGVSAWSLIFRNSQSQKLNSSHEMSLSEKDNNEKFEDEIIGEESEEDSIVQDYSDENVASLCSNITQMHLTEPAEEHNAHEIKENSIEEKNLNQMDEIHEQEEMQNGKKRFMTKKSILFALGVLVAVVALSFLVKTCVDSNKPENQFKKAQQLFQKGKTSNALTILSELADNGYIPAKTRLGCLYLLNDSIPLNIELGLKYLEEASVYDSTALKNLIKVYSGLKCKGEDCSDFKKAKHFAQIAINQKQNLPDAYFTLGWISANDEDYAKAYYYYKISAKMGCGLAYDNLGWLFWTGHGCEKDIKRAQFYFTRALDCNPEDAWALYYLGRIHELYSIGMENEDRIKAIQYFKRSAELGNEDAQLEVARIEMESSNF